jgi:hypothetical protein
LGKPCHSSGLRGVRLDTWAGAVAKRRRSIGKSAMMAHLYVKQCIRVYMPHVAPDVAPDVEGRRSRRNFRGAVLSKFHLVDQAYDCMLL